MAKYDLKFKLKVAREGLERTTGLGAISRRYGLDHSMVRRWVDSFRQHGRAGLAKKYARYDARFKQGVLDRIQSEGLSKRQAATLFGIRSPGIIGQWQRQYDEGGLGAWVPASRRRSRMPAKKPPDKALKPDEELSREELLEALADSRAEIAYLKKRDALIQAKKAAAQKKRS